MGLEIVVGIMLLTSGMILAQKGFNSCTKEYYAPRTIQFHGLIHRSNSRLLKKQSV